MNIAGLWNKLDKLKTAIYNTPEKPDVIGLCETHLAKGEKGLPPDIKGYNFFYNNYTSASAGTAIYYRSHMQAAEINVKVPSEIRHRYTAARIGDTVIIEAYAVVDSTNDGEREKFFAGLMNVLQQTEAEYPQTPRILIGDLNGHIRGWYSDTTNKIGKMIEHLAKCNNLEIVSQKAPTFCRPGKLTCIDYTLVDPKAKASLLETRKADKLHIGGDHFLQLAHFRKTTLTLKNRDEGATIRRHPVKKLRNKEIATRYKNALNETWKVVQDIEYTSTEDRYKDYCWAITQAALQILRPVKQRPNLPYKVRRHEREAMMAHNLYRNYETEGNQEAADRAKRHRNECNRRYRKSKTEFERMSKEQRRID